MDIGTAKPILQERGDVPFHLIDILDPSEPFSAADFYRLAWEAIRQIEARKKRVIVVGGTGLYLKVLEEGIFNGPSRDLKVRHELEQRFREEGGSPLHEELKRIDPIAAATIPMQNRQRLIRALEVFQVTGRPISTLWREHRESSKKRSPSFLKFGLSLPKEELHRRIDQRVDRMVTLGFVSEVQGLLEKWGRSAVGLQLIGYKEMVGFLERRPSFSEAISLIKLRTRQYAKRQGTWFRKDKEIQWIEDKKRLIQSLTKS